MLLSDWRKENIPHSNAMWKDSAHLQMEWVQHQLRYPVAVLLTRDNPLATKHCRDEVRVKVVGTHTSKSIKLPVYCLEFDNAKIVFRHNFYDWCVKIWLPESSNVSIPKYLKDASQLGFYEGMEDEKLPDANFTECFQSAEQMYSFIWWVLANRSDS